MKVLSLLLVVVCLFLGGCAALDKFAPAQYDASGNIIPGSRQATEVTKAVAGVVPYGDVALGFVLLLAAGYEKYRAAKLEKGLKATLLAGKKVANDPQMQELWDKVKDAYRQEHENAGVTNLVKAMLAKLPSVVKST
jgi:hypothetical protein